MEKVLGIKRFFDKSIEKQAEDDGRKMAQYLVSEIMPNIDHADPLNCLLSSLTLVYYRIGVDNMTLIIKPVLKPDPLID